MSDAKNPEAGKSPEQIKRELEKTREEMTRTVDELAARLDPRTQAKEAGEAAKAKAKAVADGVKEGDAKSISIVAGIAGVVLLSVIAAIRSGGNK